MELCRDSEGWGPVSPTRDFDVTLCFEEGVIFPVVFGLFLASGIIRSFQLSRGPEKPRSKKSKWVLTAKLALTLASSFASLVNLFLIALQKQQVPLISTYILEPVVLVCAASLTYFNHTRTRRASTLLLLFWPAYTTTLSIWTRTVHSIPHPFDNIHVILALKWTSVSLGLVSFFIECAGPEFEAPKLGDDAHTEHPLLTANVFSVWTFDWMTPLMRKGAKQFITEEDLPSLKPSDGSSNLGRDLGKALRKHALWKALFVAYGTPYAVAAGLKFVQDFLAFAQPQLLRLLLLYFSRYQASSSGSVSRLEGFSYAIIMFVASVAQSIIQNQYWQHAFETGMRVHAGLVTAIYAKALVLSNDERTRTSGDIVNLMSVDATRLQDLCTYGLLAISGPLQIALAFISLYNLLGWSAFVGVAMMTLSIPMNTILTGTLKRMQEEQMKNRDKRSRLMSELLANIKSIKLYAWEYSFARKILEARNDKELKMLKRIGMTISLNQLYWTGVPVLVSFSSFAAAAIVSSRPLTADVIFPVITLFNLLQDPLAMFGQVTSSIIEAWVSVQRLSDFLNAAELQTDARKVLHKLTLAPGDEVLSIRDGDFAWALDAVEPTLEGINLSVKKGDLVGVLGRVGSGKTSLLSAILGGMYRKDGEVVLSGSIAYAPQNPWILSASVRENILFFHEYDEDFYNLVIEACALTQDLSVLPQGDLTEVGEKGITLSGGQRARVSLARAVYARADLTLLDDCLAAVDSHVARHVFDHVIGPTGILATKARILVTNSIAFIRQFDHLAFVRRGIVLEQGSYATLMTNPESEVSKLIRDHGTEASSSSGASTPFPRGGSPTPKGDRVDGLTHISGSEQTTGIPSRLSIRRKSFVKAKVAPPAPTRAPSSTGLSKEHQEQGRVKIRVYMEYIQAASKAGCACFLLAIILQQLTDILGNLTLRYWGERNREAGSNTSISKYLMIYGFFSFSSTLLGGLSAVIIWVWCSLRSARRLHDRMLDSLIRAPMSFFELTPMGRILNLFSRDIYAVDQVLARVVSNLIRNIASHLGIIAVIGFSFPSFLILALPMGWFYSRVMKYFLASSRELKRLDAVSRSPIFAWFSESLSGYSTIRAFNQQPVFLASNERRIDRNQMCYLPIIAINRWLAIRLEFGGAFITFIVAVLALIALATTGIDAGLVGLVLTYALDTSSSMNSIVRSAGEVEQNIISVERILHQTNVNPEAPFELPEAKTDEEWPVNGEVEFKDYSTRYRVGLDLVLKNISMKIMPREKIGVCGRTGAGKSSLLLALFRIIEPASGAIFIDGVEITKIGLHDLRSAISIVPQTPDLFEGTLRENIDPVGHHTDTEIWAALSQAHLKEYVETLPEGLEAPVREGGSSLSSGQKQLLCFARALLRKSKILVLDEATSAVDLETDRAIQDIIRGPAFANVTVFTIAHRLNTILESDRILVMSSGKIAELESPRKLLEDKNTIFYSLANEAGLVSRAHME